VIDGPSVAAVVVQGQKMYQVAGGEVREGQTQQAPSGAPADADIQLVAQQTGRSLEESKKALADAGGDLAKAILQLKSANS